MTVNVARTDFSDQVRKQNIIYYHHIDYIINEMLQSACLVVKADAALFNCTPVGRVSDSVMVQT